ncbi:MAG: FtsQ-type POTRA domain-containing protein [Deltaproteobacteria bacterium]|nr:FtsQ-type POTRA domain-containing protein [Deltaproteobacteria bacterium]
MIVRLARWRWLGLAGVALLGLAVAAWSVREPAAAALRHHPYFVVNRVVIQGADSGLTPDDVRAWIGLTEATTVWEAAPAAVRERLEANPYVARATVKRQFPGTLEIVVHERQPQAIAVLDDLYYVDRSGVTFGPLRAGDTRDLPLVTGLDPKASEGARRWMLRRALRLLRRCDGPQCLGPLSEVHVDAARGVTVFPAAPRVPVLLGWGSWPVKIERARRALEAWQGTPERLARLDTRFRNQVVATVRPLPAPAVPAAKSQPRPRGRGLKVKA